MTLPERVKAALDRHPQHQDLRLIAGGWAEARKRYAEDKSSANRKEWKALEKDLVEILDGLEPADQPGPQPGWRWCEEAKAWPDPLPNRNKVEKYWKAMGWKVGRSSWYGEKGKACAPTSVEGWSQVAVNEYARVEGTALPGTPASRWQQPAAKPTKAERMGVVDPNEQVANLTEALKAERRKGLALDNALKTLKLDIEQGKFVAASELHEKQFGLAVVMYERIKEELSAMVPTIIRTAAGDPGLHAPVEQALRDTLDKGVRAAMKQEVWTVLLENMRN